MPKEPAMSPLAPLFKTCSALLCYPEGDLPGAVPELRAALAASPDLLARVAPLLDWLETEDLILLQEAYVQLFDRNPAHSLHLFEHIHGEDRDRGQAMVDLLEEYRQHGFEPVCDELPDYLPLFLEFLSLCEPEEGARLLGDAVHVLNHVGEKLVQSQSPYAGVFQVLVAQSPVAPEPLVTPPVRDMDEAMETFGPGPDGVEPLLRPGRPALAPVNFYPHAPQP
ncbi:nitrate reductase molybdenum cofactor assembly chaperone [Azospira inquinata]|nr:nitrate reductase molybdenum cofactor assembly chaperone [Azospira inquinata]